MAYDSARGVTVLFGGRTISGLLLGIGDTWEWDGTRWMPRATSGPSPRMSTMVYDAARGEVVLFGGIDINSSTTLGDTWEWNGSTWNQRMVSGPPARRGHGMAYDAARSRTVLYGGISSSGQSLADTWEWDGASWVQQQNGPGATASANRMAFDAAAGSVVVINPTQIWRWSGQQWSTQATNIASNLSYAATTYDSGRQTLQYVTQAYSSSTWHTEVWELRGSTWTLRGTGGPLARYDRGTVYDTTRGETLMFGGWTTTGVVLGDLWAWNGSVWHVRAGGSPSVRAGANMAYDSRRGAVTMFGGFAGSGYSDFYLGDTWEWGANGWALAATGGPAPRFDHAMAFDRGRGVTVLYGGRSHDSSGHATIYSDTWEWNGVTWTRRATTGPPIRDDIFDRMAYDESRGVCVLTAYQLYSPTPVTFQETWQWNGTSWLRRLESAAPGALVYNSARAAVTALSPGRGIYEWNGAAWVQLPNSALPVATVKAAVFDSLRSRIVIVGSSGGGAGASNDTWEWDGTAWAQRQVTGPPPRTRTAMAYDAATGRTVLFGGYDASYEYLSDTWDYTADERLGDIDSDCQVDASDAAILARILLGESVPAPQLARADVNHDGVTDGVDIQAFVIALAAP